MRSAFRQFDLFVSEERSTLASSGSRTRRPSTDAPRRSEIDLAGTALVGADLQQRLKPLP
jgi:hypothetical protein